MRAAMKPGWEDLVRRCIQKFHTQHEGESLSYAKRHHHEGRRLCILLYLTFIQLLPVGTFIEEEIPKARLTEVLCPGAP